MVKTYNSILIFEKGIDLKHLDSQMKKHEINAVFEKEKAVFLEKYNANDYNLLVISLIEEDDTDQNLLEIIGPNTHVNTPVLLIIDNNNLDHLPLAMKYGCDFITFPFTPDEFIIRIQCITRKKETEDAIRGAILNYKSLFDNFPLGIIQTNEHGIFLKSNPELLNIIEMKESDMEGLNFFQLCHPDDYFIKRKQLDRLLRQEVNSVKYEIRIINNEGNTTVCKVLASAVWENNNILKAFTFLLEKTG